MADQILIWVALGGILVLLVRLYELLILKPKQLRAKLQRQGIRGPSPHFLFGNIFEMKRLLSRVNSTPTTSTAPMNLAAAIAYDWPSTVFPYLVQWRKEFGSVFLYSVGHRHLLSVTDVEMVRGIGTCTSLSLGKPTFLSKDAGPLFGRGILSSSGHLWAHQRKIIAPELFINKVKGMVNLMVDSTIPVLRNWEKRTSNEIGIADIKIDEDLRCLTADVISRACFGSNYSQGKEVFLKLKTLKNLISESVAIPGLRLMLPTKNNRAIWKTEKEINSIILKVVHQRNEASGGENDLLQAILEGAKIYDGYDGLSVKMSRDKFIIDNCKTIYFAGHETTAATASWSLMLLAAHPEWQDHARAEVLEICGDKPPSADMLLKMKTLRMVIHETLRLFPVAPFVVREALQDFTFKELMIPKGINILIPILILHRDHDLWGADAQKFNPGRFANGIGGACEDRQAYIPFGLGSRVCAGQHIAMTELKVILSLMLSKFSFSLSPGYRHSPTYGLAIVPEHGVSLRLRRLSS